MPIRFRLLLVALIAMLGIGAAIGLGLEAAQLKEQQQAARVAHLRWAQDSSDLVFRLQRERGVSARAEAIGMSDTIQLRRLRGETSQSIEALLENPLATPTRLGHMGLDGLPVKLMEVRRQVDTRAANWRELRNTYTALINTLEGIVEFELIGGIEEPSRSLGELADLVLARESLSLLQATVASVQSPAARLAGDFFSISGEWTMFRHHVATLDERIKPITTQADFQWVQSAIADTLAMPDGSRDRVSPSVWWDRSTATIDAFKALEDQLFAELTQEAQHAAIAQKRQVVVMGIVSVVVLSGLVLFVGGTIRRMVRDLRALSTALNEIVSKDDFTVRLRVGSSKDELSHAFEMFNRLLSFTERLLREKEYLASMDALTGVMNRRSFLAYAQREMARAQRYGNSLSLLFLDIDHFKAVNDTFGHATGDAVLKAFVGAIKVRARTSDLVARWGGEEFIVLAPETDLQHALAFAESLRDSVAQTQFPEVGRITCSLGVATWVVGESFDGFCARADAALYQAKATGRNRVCAAGNTEPIATIKEEG